MTTEAQKRAAVKYCRENTQNISIRFNKNTEADLLEYLQTVDNVAGLVKQLIREEMKRGGRA